MDDRQIIVDNLADELVSVHGMENEFGEKRHYFFFFLNTKQRRSKFIQLQHLLNYYHALKCQILGLEE